MVPPAAALGISGAEERRRVHEACKFGFGAVPGAAGAHGASAAQRNKEPPPKRGGRSVAPHAPHPPHTLFSPWHVHAFTLGLRIWSTGATRVLLYYLFQGK